MTPNLKFEFKEIEILLTSRLKGFDVLRSRSKLGYGLDKLDSGFLVLLKWLKNSSTHLLNMESYIFKSVIIL